MPKSRAVKKRVNAFAFVDNLTPSWFSHEVILKQHYRQYSEVQQHFLTIAAFNHLQGWVVGQAEKLLAKLAAILSSQLKNVVSMSKIHVQYNTEYQMNRCCMDLMLLLVAKVNEHIANLIDINDIQQQINACYSRFFKWEKKLKDLL